MHREVSHSDELGQDGPPLSLYLLTALLGALIGADLWPVIAGWFGGLPTWPRELFGYRFALLAAILGGSRILYGALESLFEGRWGADLALALACIAAILIGEPLVAAEVVFIGMLGEVLEAFTFERTQRAVRSLVEIAPQRCWLLRDGQEVRILVSELKEGDRVVVKPGARIPADGVVCEGRSSVDVSALTGESLPVEKGPGDEVLAGALNQLGALTVEARRVAGDTVLGRVLSLTVKALREKSSGERNADRLARYFLPVVLGLATLTFLVGLLYHSGSRGLPADAVRLTLGEAAKLAAYPALAVLVVACPCALILATPAAVLAALGRLAGTGVLIKGGAALEGLAEVNTFAFDKTGTLTEGRLELGDVLPIGNLSPDEVLRAAAVAEQGSEHVLARLILAEATSRNLEREPLQAFLAHPGGGVTGRTAASTYVVGTRRLLEEQGVPVPAEAQRLLEQLDAGGQTALLVARDGVLLGAVGARDRVRPEAADVLAELRSLGMDIALLTGDRKAAALAVAERLNITEVHAELLPEQKAELVGDAAPGLEGGARRKVAMVGDGINDAPALARARVGLAVGGSGTEVAAEAGDVVFMGDPLRSLPLLVRLSRETVRIIRQNIIVFAFGVNLAGVVLTAWLWPLLAPAGWWYEQSPLVAVLYHQLGSLLVLLNSMRLLWFERPADGPRRLAWRRRILAVNGWMERNLNVDDWLHSLGHHWRRVLATGAVLLVPGYGLSGLAQVNADEVGVVRRFGRLLPENLEPGLHWRWPWPVEKVVKVQPRRLRSLEVGFRTLSSQTPEARTWESQHGKAIQRYADEAVMVTGDGQLVELQATVHYTIAEVRVYLFAVRQPEAALREATEAVLREVAAGRKFNPLLTSQREQFQRDVFERLKQRCASPAPGLGIRLEGLWLQELHPPPEVVASYHEVARATEEAKTALNEAEAARTLRLQEAESLRLREQREAAVARTRLTSRAAVDLYAFLQRWQARRHLSLVRESRLLLDTLRQFKPGQTHAETNRVYARLRGEALRTQARWSDDLWRLEMLASKLPGKDMTLIDPGVPKSQIAFQYALDQLRELVPSWLRLQRPVRPRPLVGP